MRTLALFFLLTLSLCLNAQTFVKHFTVDGVSTQAYALEVHDTAIFIAGIIADTSVDNGIKSFLLRLNAQGEVVHQTTLRPEGYMHYVATRENSMITTHDGGLACVGYALDTGATPQLFISVTKYDINGDILWYKIINPGLVGYKTIFPYKLIERSNGDLFLTGAVQFANNVSRVFLAKVDSSGALHYVHPYYTLPLFSLGRGLCFTPTGNLLISAYSQTNPVLPYWTSVQNTCFLEVDTAGNQVALHCTTDSNTRVEYNITPTADGNYLSSGAYYAYRNQGSGFRWEEDIVKWSPSFSKIWETRTGSQHVVNAFTDFQQDSNGDIYLCGLNLASTGIYAGFNGVLAKVDGSGNLMWYHTYRLTGVDNSDHNLYDLDIAPNGDLLAVGYWQWNYNFNNPLEAAQVAWLIRANSGGCMDDGSCGIEWLSTEQAGSGTVQPSIIISPNPSADGIFSVHTFVDLSPCSFITVFDANGRQISRQPLMSSGTLLNLYHQPSGIYFYRVSNGLEEIQSGKVLIQK